MSGSVAERSVNKNEGFVLPYVLVVIFVLALTSTIAVRSIGAAGQVITALDADFMARQRLASAEADTLYVFLTSAAVKGGIDTSYTPWTTNDMVDGFDVTKLPSNAIWSASGGQRTSRYPSGNVTVSYRDVSGLVPLNRNAPELLDRLFKGVGLKSDVAKSAAAKLGDYIDSDNRRRFRGGERADYRLKRMPPPTNAYLRAHEEVYRILGWKKMITPPLYERLRRYTTLTTSTTYYRKRFLSSDVARTLGLDDSDGKIRRLSSQNMDMLDALTSTVEMPTQQGRFIFSTSQATGKTIIRAIEVERSPMAPDRPFRRYVVFEETRDASDNSESENAQNGASIPIFPTSDRLIQ
ncbi:MAG: type II secretion system protein GspK [Robiginitomaculum sp.]|nr:type II secretion system protein GspK [Robiginitomaculum sp.]